jgi:hypothetical protein
MMDDPTSEMMPGQSSDPMEIIDEAVESGMAAEEAGTTDVPADKAELVKSWWDRTTETKDFTECVDQYERDRISIDGGVPEDVLDAAEVTVNHIYRNAIQGVAMTVPEMSTMEWKPREEVQAVAGFILPPQIKQILQQRRTGQLGLAAVLSVLFHRYAERCNLQEKIEAVVQDSFHFRMAAFKIWWAYSLTEDPISQARPADEQDLLAKARTEIEAYNAGDFRRDDARYAQLRETLSAIGKTEQDIKRGIMVEIVPLRNYRVDPAVSGPEYEDTKAWERHDVLMRKSKILQKWPDVKKDDLAGCYAWALDETGEAIRQDKIEDTNTIGDTQAPRSMQDSKSRKDDDDWHLVAEIYDYETNTRLVLIDGLDYPAVEEPIERGPTGMSPFCLLIQNRRSGHLAGFSDTELQAKIQNSMNKKRTAEEDSRRNAQPRWGYDKRAFTKPGDLKAAHDAPSGSFTGIEFQGRSEDFEKSIFNLAGNHDHNPLEFDTTKEIQEMRKMAMLPEQASGELGGAEFATEVQVAAAGANALARYRQNRITRFLKKVGDKIAQLILLNVPQDLAIQDAGPLAEFFYPAKQMDRQEIYRGLQVTTEAKMDRALDYSKRAEALARLIEAFRGSGIKFDEEMAGKVLAKFMDLDEAQDMIRADPNELVAKLVEAIQKDPQSLAPDAVMALAQVGQMAQQQVMQMQQEQQMQQMQQQQAQGQPAPGMG